MTRVVFLQDNESNRYLETYADKGKVMVRIGDNTVYERFYFEDRKDIKRFIEELEKAMDESKYED